MGSLWEMQAASVHQKLRRTKIMHSEPAQKYDRLLTMMRERYTPTVRAQVVRELVKEI